MKIDSPRPTTFPPKGGGLRPLVRVPWPKWGNHTRKSSLAPPGLPRKNHKVKKELAPTATIRGTSALEPPQDEAQISRYSSLTAFTNGTRSNWYQVIFLRQRQLKCESWALSLLFWHRPGIPLYDMVFFLEPGPLVRVRIPSHSSIYFLKDKLVQKYPPIPIGKRAAR